MIVCSGPNCQTTAGCRCGRRADMTAWPSVLGPSRADVERAFAAGRLAGIREAAEVARGYPINEQGALAADPFAAAKQARDGIEVAILALAERGEG